jgi:hypothetical protein
MEKKKRVVFIKKIKTCSFEGCVKKGTYAMSNGEYHYCDEHSAEKYIVGECADCGIELHSAWDLGSRPCGDYCRPCNKSHECADCEYNESDEEEEVWTEQCEKCGEYLGGRKDWTEEEFDEHPDREEGYDDDGQWHCAKCRVK